MHISFKIEMFVPKVILFCCNEIQKQNIHMKETLLKMKQLFAGNWYGEGFAKFPTINDTAYTEELEFIPDSDKDAIYFNQKTWYKNHADKNGHTVFWDAGFIILKEAKILLHSIQVGGRIESYELANAVNQTFTFNSVAILNDLKAARSQRIFRVYDDAIHYELNMALHTVSFQNHLSADLKRATLNKTI